MMKKIATLLLIASITLTSFAQETDDRYTKTNSIYYGELIFGSGAIFKDGTGAGALNLGVGLNYQHKKSLYTLRYNHVVDFTIGFVFIIPVEIQSATINEYAALYGRRWLFKGSSISLSGGLSIQQYTSKIDGGQVFENINVVGIPLEFNVRFFKRRKRTFRAYYGLIPIGEPTSFGRGFGLKLSGNIASRGFLSFGITYSLGSHKYY